MQVGHLVDPLEKRKHIKLSQDSPNPKNNTSTCFPFRHHPSPFAYKAVDLSYSRFVFRQFQGGSSVETLVRGIRVNPARNFGEPRPRLGIEGQIIATAV
jgi:hypothetical protein